MCTSGCEAFGLLSDKREKRDLPCVSISLKPLFLACFPTPKSDENVEAADSMDEGNWRESFGRPRDWWVGDVYLGS